MPTLNVRFSFTFVMAVVAAALITYVVRALAIRVKALDVPDYDRKIHTEPKPLLGGLAIYSAVAVTIGVLSAMGWLSDDRVPLQLIAGILIGGAVLMFFGALDDRFHLPWWQQLVGSVLAILVMLAAGLTMPYVTNPLGSGLLRLDQLVVGGIMIPIAQVFVFLWIIGMIYTTKLLDGIDGLATSISFVGAMVIFVVSLFWDRSGSTTSFAALALAGGCLGFLFWNWHPAKIFLGEGGSTFLGFMLAVLSILSGGKIATALLIMGVPILDVVWIIIRRLVAGKAMFAGDSKHLHFRLLKIGLSQRQVVFFLSALSLLFGSVSFFFTTRGKLTALAVLLLFMILMAIILVTHNEKSTSHR